MTADAREQLILDIWAGVDNESAGADELELIQKELLEQSKIPVAESPASIARTLADHGVRLRHPEILEADLRWRQTREIGQADRVEHFGDTGEGDRPARR